MTHPASPVFYYYSFQTKIKKQSVNAILASFLKEKDGDLTEKEKVWWAVSAFWLPIAMQQSKEYTREEIVQYGLSAIMRLQHQIASLALALNLEIPSVFSTPAVATNHRSEFEVTPLSDAEPPEGMVEDEALAQVENSPLSQKTVLTTNSDNFDSVFGYQ